MAAKNCRATQGAGWCRFNTVPPSQFAKRHRPLAYPSSSGFFLGHVTHIEHCQERPGSSRPHTSKQQRRRASMLHSSSRSGAGSRRAVMQQQPPVPQLAPAQRPAATTPRGSANAAAAAASSRLRLAVVGDVHGQWCSVRDAAALEVLQPDVTLFVGDIGNENVALVTDIASLPRRKAVIMGNHDAREF